MDFSEKCLDFINEYNLLNESLHGFNAEDEDWFLPALLKLIQKHGTETAYEYIGSGHSSIYSIELFIKAGLRGVDKGLLLEIADGKDEDEVYGAALSLAISGYEEGYELLRQFADKTHPLSKHIDPITDILPDLIYLDEKRVDSIQTRIEMTKDNVK